MNKLVEKFGSNVFGDEMMRSHLPQSVYQALVQAREVGRRLTQEEANTVAEAMKEWALEKGATHFTHWFQPMTGITAEKHEAFITPGAMGRVITEFSGKELIRSEPDASSFPSGGLRATFEARGYTAWDPTSYAFVKDNVLCIPTAFCSYGGEAIDKKTPLLRSMGVLSEQAVRILRLFGDDKTRAVKPMVGAEQEYFLVDRAMFQRRRDLVYTGRTLVGARPPKGQELDDHYFGAIKPRVAAFMEALNQELWELGVPAKTEHNEVAPAQHELASVYASANITADQNQLVMERMKRIADRLGMVCLLHEKPFAGVNGSGKHNNWSLATDSGENLLNPGDTPSDNAKFLLFLVAVLEAVDEYQDLLRISVASAGNDHRLGGDEAPPAILSVFLGDELTGILEAIKNDMPYEGGERQVFKVGVHVLPRFTKDATDRNRTSPFAFTGNKFEFRMVGSSASISEANIMLNTAVADVLRRYADELEVAPDFDAALHDLIRTAIKEHDRILFNGNGYDSAWVEEAARRGLLNLKSTPECLPYLLSEKNEALFTRNRVLSSAELHARYDIMMDHYAKEVKIEALTLIDMVRKDILPAVSRFIGQLGKTADYKKKLLGSSSVRYEREAAEQLSDLQGKCWEAADALDRAVAETAACPDAASFARACSDTLLPLMEQLRGWSDAMECIVGKPFWPYPSYGEILFSVY